MIRFFSVVAPAPHGDLPYRFLKALTLTKRPIRVLPIGPAVAMAQEKRWYDLEHLFVTPPSIPFVNVVCAPVGYQLGSRAPLSAMGGTSDLAKQEGRTTDVSLFPPELRSLLARDIGALKDHDDVVYIPQTAFMGLWTANVRNVAIVIGDERDDVPLLRADDHELGALTKYDVIVFANGRIIPDMLVPEIQPGKRVVVIEPPRLDDLELRLVDLSIDAIAGRVAHVEDLVIGETMTELRVSELAERLREELIRQVRAKAKQQIPAPAPRQQRRSFWDRLAFWR